MDASGNVFVAGLDQYVADLQINQAWLDEQLAANTQPHIFTFAHAPAFQVYHIENMSRYPENRDAFWTSLIAAGSRAYFTGHDHMYDLARLDERDRRDRDRLEAEDEEKHPLRVSPPAMIAILVLVLGVILIAANLFGEGKRAGGQKNEQNRASIFIHIT